MLIEKLTLLDGSDVPDSMGFHYIKGEKGPKLIIDTKEDDYKGLHKIKVVAEYDAYQTYKLVANYKLIINLSES